MCDFYWFYTERPLLLQNCLQQLLRLRAAFELQLAPGLAAAGEGARVGRSHDPGMLLVRGGRCDYR